MHSEPSFAIFNGYKQIKKSIYGIYEINRNPVVYCRYKCEIIYFICHEKFNYSELN